MRGYDYAMEASTRMHEVHAQNRNAKRSVVSALILSLINGCVSVPDKPHGKPERLPTYIELMPHYNRYNDPEIHRKPERNPLVET